MISNPSVAVLLAAYNGMDWIEEQILSILSQKNTSIKIFISVDLSNDKTHQWCQSLAANNARIQVLPYGEEFGGAARNFFRLIRDVVSSDFDYIALSDQDDIWESGKLQHAIRVIEKNNLDGYSSDVIAFWSNGRERLVKKSSPQKKFDYFFEAAGPGCTYVLKQHSLQKFKKFLINNWREINLIESHDWLIYAFFRSRNMPWYIDNKPLMLYRQHELNQVGSNFGFLAYLKRIKMIKNGWYRSEVGKIAKVISINDGRLSLDKWTLIKKFYLLRRQRRDAFILLLMITFGIF